MGINVNSVTKNSKNKTRNFFWWSAGAISHILEKCPTEQVKFSSIGILMVFISILASVSFAFFLSLSFDVQFLTALPFGLVWGAMIFCLDRVLLTSYRKGETSNISIIQRFVLTIAIAVLIGEPMLLYFFRSEINLELVQKGQTVAVQTRHRAEERYKSEIEKLLNENKSIQDRLDALNADRATKESDSIKETEGLSGTGISGFGDSARQKEVALKNAETRLREFQAQSAPIIENNTTRLAEINLQIEKEITGISEIYSQAKGILARHEALFSIIKRDAGAAAVYIPLFIILLLLETLPLSLKVFSKKGIYDEMLASYENQQKKEIKQYEIYEMKQQEFQIDSLARLEERIYKAVLENKINELNDVDLINLAQQIKTENLLRIKEKRIRHQFAAFNEVEFGDAISIEVLGVDGFEFVCQLPKQNLLNFSIQTLSADINRIGLKIGESLGGKVRFVKAFTSRMREISENLPLFVQLENDRKLILEFEPTGGSI